MFRFCVKFRLVINFISNLDHSSILRHISTNHRLYVKFPTSSFFFQISTMHRFSVEFKFFIDFIPISTIINFLLNFETNFPLNFQLSNLKSLKINSPLTKLTMTFHHFPMMLCMYIILNRLFVNL